MEATTVKLIEKRCHKHLNNQGITSKQTLMHHLQQIFEQAEHQNSALIGLYKMLFPEWERIERIEGYPVVGRGLWQYIANLFIHFDQEHHPQVLNGGLWINSGFASSDDIGPWEISMECCNVIYA